MHERINRLGQEVTARWKRGGFSYPQFPGIALACLKRADLQEAFQFEKFTQWLGKTKRFPRQFDHRSVFGEPPVTLFYDPQERFIIDLYFWRRADTSIHDHGFSGACVVLQGSSLHVKYRFEASKRYAEGMAVGRVTQLGGNLLRPGDAFCIPSGEKFIHQVFHLGHPTVSLVIRTTSDPGVPQFDYHPPSLALPAQYLVQPVGHIRQRMLAFLEGLGTDQSQKFQDRVLSKTDAIMALEMFRDSLRRPMTSERFEERLRKLETRFGPQVSGLREAAVRWVGTSEFSTERLKEEGERVFAALIIAFGFGEEMFQIIRSFRPGVNVRETVSQWLQQLILARALNPKLLIFAYDMLEDRGSDWETLIERHGLTRLELEIAQVWNIRSIRKLAVKDKGIFRRPRPPLKKTSREIATHP